MRVTKNVEEIAARLAEVENRLALINAGIDKELKKSFFDRAPRVCVFLDMEKKTYSAVRDVLKWLTDD